MIIIIMGVAIDRRWIGGRGSTGPHKMATVQKRIRYSEGDVYEGQWSSEGKREGKGKLQMSTGDQYSGEFMNGFFHGLGVLVHSDGGKYEGSFELGRYHGHGIYTHSDRTKYEGQFSQGSIKGLGLVTFSDGTHGEPKNEGKFEGLELVQRCSAATAVQRARQLAADARSMQL